jgi:hypothetical protein
MLVLMLVLVLLASRNTLMRKCSQMRARKDRDRGDRAKKQRALDRGLVRGHMYLDAEVRHLGGGRVLAAPHLHHVHELDNGKRKTGKLCYFLTTNWLCEGD